MSTPFRSLIPAILLILTGGCATTPAAPSQPSPAPAANVNPAPCRPGDALIGAALWVRSSAEYQATMTQLYAVARERLDQGLADRQWAAIGIAGSELPPAVILDSDETIFDNVEFEGQMVAYGTFYDGVGWNAWVQRAAARAIPGAVEFVQYAQQRGVTPFFITNRGKAQETATRANLEKLGVQLRSDEDTVLTRGERPEWSGDKTSRREHVAATHRVLLLIGDDLNDFIETTGRTPAQRDVLVRDSAASWGRQWILIPNPMYGSWNSAATGRLGDECAEYRKKIELLTP